MKSLLLLGVVLSLCISCTAHAGGGDVRISPSSADSASASVLVSGVPLPGVCFPYAGMTTADGREWVHAAVAWLGPGVEVTAVSWSQADCTGLYSDPSNSIAVPEPPFLLEAGP